MDFQKSMLVSTSGLKAQSLRMRVIAENIANADSVSLEPGKDPYRRKVVQFTNELDRAEGINRVKVKKVTVDRSAFRREYAPNNPAADPDGYINAPNVNGIIESTDLKEAQRSYEANLSAVESAKTMTMRTIDLLR